MSLKTSAGTSTPLPGPGRRICVVGTSGSGKTFVAQALAAKLGLAYVCNDAAIWSANWQPTPREQVYAELDAATSGDGWTFDGNLGPSPEDQLVFGRCDTVVWLDLPRREVWWSVTKRTLWRAWTKEPMWHGNTERWRTVFSRDSMIWWSMKTFGRRRRVYGAMFDGQETDRVQIRLRSRDEVNRWLASL